MAISPSVFTKGLFDAVASDDRRRDCRPGIARGRDWLAAPKGSSRLPYRSAATEPTDRVPDHPRLEVLPSLAARRQCAGMDRSERRDRLGREDEPHGNPAANPRVLL